jgi:hypothetical protein
MSRLDAVAAELRVGRDQARRFTRAVRRGFDAAPSYAVILRAIRDVKSQRGATHRPSAGEIAAVIRSAGIGDSRARATAPRQGKGRPSPRGRPRHRRR